MCFLGEVLCARKVPRHSHCWLGGVLSCFYILRSRGIPEYLTVSAFKYVVAVVCVRAFCGVKRWCSQRSHVSEEFQLKSRHSCRLADNYIYCCFQRSGFLSSFPVSRRFCLCYWLVPRKQPQQLSCMQLNNSDIVRCLLPRYAVCCDFFPLTFVL